jgi:hypothetical protein
MEQSSVFPWSKLCFNLEVEDGWPPIAVEEVPSEKVSGGYKVLMPPLFVKDLSVGDVVTVLRDEKGYVDTWSHVFRSDRTTVWLLRLKNTPAIGEVLSDLRALGCNTVSLAAVGSFSVDLPADVPIASVDAILERLDRNEVGIAYPSFRHPEAPE